MAAVTDLLGNFFFGAAVVSVTVTYDNVTLAISRINVTNGGSAACIITALHPTTGNTVTLTVNPHTSRNVNVPNNTYFMGDETGTIAASEITIWPQS